ncbi:YdiU family protein [Desulfurivibrio sp. D14AmB]|uniref:protein adenylyltransferase SelO n=1 Tax=Desulfurivibrio sp. D14AmB TaxID=3374370 RepID=UPI00376F2420
MPTAPAKPANPGRFNFANSYARLPEHFFARLAPTPVAAPQLIQLNRPLSVELGLDPEWLGGEQGVAVLAGNSLPPGAEPLAMAYAGHQFGAWVPQLGDGRAILLGEVVDRKGRRRDIQLKGAGPTPFSRGGDGRAALGPVLREYLISEAMAALGIPTTRAMAAVLTGELVVRETRLAGAILTRVAQSHVRVGTFQFFAARDDRRALIELTDYLVGRHYPELAGTARAARILLRELVQRQAGLVAAWMLVGFIHGVMNTDNTSIVGETIDYGPCAFMDAYHPETVFSSIDHYGRYAYANQQAMAHGNVARLAQSLLPLLADNPEEALAVAREEVARFPELFQAAWLAGMRRKIGLREERAEDRGLIEELLALMAANRADFTLTFRGLCRLETVDLQGDQELRRLFERPEEFEPWAQSWRSRLAAEGSDDRQRRAAMEAVNPAFIPRNHRVEEVIRAGYQGDFSRFRELLAVLAAPFADQPEFIRYARPPRPEEVVTKTFCGT